MNARFVKVRTTLPRIPEAAAYAGRHALEAAGYILLQAGSSRRGTDSSAGTHRVHLARVG
jgi:hypothetical protein